MFRCCSGVSGSWSGWSCLRCRGPSWRWSVQGDSWSLKRSRTSRLTPTSKSWSATSTWSVSDLKRCWFDAGSWLTSSFLFSSSCVWCNQKLPEQAYLHPPLTLFVVEHRAFGRLALVGSYVVQSLMDYAPPELGGEPDEEEEEPKPKGKSEERSSEGRIHRSTVYFNVGVFCLFISQLCLHSWTNKHQSEVWSSVTGCFSQLCSPGVVKSFTNTVCLCVSPVRMNTTPITPLTSMKKIGLSGLSIKQSKIPLNPMKLVNVRMLNSPTFSALC